MTGRVPMDDIETIDANVTDSGDAVIVMTPEQAGALRDWLVWSEKIADHPDVIERLVLALTRCGEI